MALSLRINVAFLRPSRGLPLRVLEAAAQAVFGNWSEAPPGAPVAPPTVPDVVGLSDAWGRADGSTGLSTQFSFSPYSEVVMDLGFVDLERLRAHTEDSETARGPRLTCRITHKQVHAYDLWRPVDLLRRAHRRDPDRWDWNEDDILDDLPDHDREHLACFERVAEAAAATEPGAVLTASPDYLSYAPHSQLPRGD